MRISHWKTSPNTSAFGPGPCARISSAPSTRSAPSLRDGAVDRGWTMNQQLSEPKQHQHYSEADLLETYYMQPGASMPVMMHLADCGDCAWRYERLEKKVRGLSACAHDDKPDTFWARQRFSVMRKLNAQRPSHARIARVAAAAVLVAALGGWFSSRQVEPPATTRV